MDFITVFKTLCYRFSVQVVVLSLLVIAFLAGKISKPLKTKLRRLPPGPPTWPIIGNLAGMVANRPTSKWIHRVMSEMQTEIACFRFVGVHVIAVISDEIAREALRDKDEVFADRPETYSSGLISGGFKTVAFSHYGGDQWKKMRRVMTSEVMSPRTLNILFGARTMEANNLLAYVQNLYIRSKTVNVRDITMTYAYSVTMRMMFGRRPFKELIEDEHGGLGPKEKEHIDAIFDTLNFIFSFSISDYIPCLRGRGLDRQEKKAREANENLMKYTDTIVDEKIELWKKKGGKETVEDWLDILITAEDAEGKPLSTPEEIKAQSREISVAAIDNPTNNVEWTLAEMLNQPEIMKKATEELDKVVGRDRLVQESDIPNLNYIKACSRESFRLHPVESFLVPHVAMEDTTLAGYFIPKGSHILMSRIGLGRNPKIWDEPHAFRPERHLSGNRRLPGVSLLELEMRFVSFGTGRRSCVASKVGTYMTLMLLARLLQGFKWSLPPGSGRVELVESETSMFMAKPLVASVKHRLAPHMYPKLRN